MILYDRGGHTSELAEKLKLSITELESLKRNLRRATEKFLEEGEQSSGQVELKKSTLKGTLPVAKSYRDNATEKIELTKIELLPLEDIRGRLEDMGLPSSIPADFQRAIMRSAPSPAAHLLNLFR